MGRNCLQGTADTPLQAVAAMERAWIDYEGKTCRVEPTIEGIWNTFIYNVNEHKAFFNASETIAHKVLEGIARMEDESFIPLTPRKFSYMLSDNPDKEGQRHDLGWASLKREYACKIGKTPITIEAQTGINNSAFSAAAENFYGWELKQPAEAKLFYARHNFHDNFWNFGTDEWRVRSKFTPRTLPERYRREIADAVQEAYRNAGTPQPA